MIFRWKAVDRNGNCYVFSRKPKPYMRTGTWDCRNITKGFVRFKLIEHLPPPDDFTKTLVKIGET